MSPVKAEVPRVTCLRGQKIEGATIVNKHFGSREAALESGKKLNDIREVVASHLAREVISK